MMLQNLDKMSGKIDLIQQLRTKTLKLRKLYNHQVDTDDFLVAQ